VGANEKFKIAALKANSWGATYWGISSKRNEIKNNHQNPKASIWFPSLVIKKSLFNILAKKRL
jgi:hypothetical protein